MVDKFKGTGVALVTPFKKDNSIDFEALERVLIFTAAEGQGVDYWVVLGTTGESVTLSKEEKNEILSFVVNHNPAKLPVVYGIGGNNTAELLHTLEKTDFRGVDAILSVSPYYNKPSQEGIYAHYRTLADHSPLPIILYNVPGRTSSNIAASTTLRLAAHPKIIAIKEACNDLTQAIEIAKNKPEDFLLLSGDDMLAVPMIAIGAEGVISVLANAFPVLFSQMIRGALQGDFKNAAHKLYQFAGINPLMYEESNPTGVKQAMALLEICSNQVRLPLLPASGGLKTKIAASLPGQLVAIK